MPQIAARPEEFRRIIGVVTRAGERLKTIQVRLAGQKWNDRIKKSYKDPSYILVSDPTRSTRVGDVITLRNGYRVSKHIRHVVTSIVTPFGSPLSERAPIPSEEERQAQLKAKRLARDARQAERGRPAATLRMQKHERSKDYEEGKEQGKKKMEDTLREVVENKLAELKLNDVAAKDSKSIEWVYGDRGSALSTTPFQVLRQIALLRFRLEKTKMHLEKFEKNGPSVEKFTSGAEGSEQAYKLSPSEAYEKYVKTYEREIEKCKARIAEFEADFPKRKDITAFQAQVPEAFGLVEEAVQKRLEEWRSQSKIAEKAS